MVKVALDAMGGDNAPSEIVKGAIDAVTENKEVKVYLVGKEALVKDELSKYKYNADQVEVVDATEVIEMAEPPVMAIRKKKDGYCLKPIHRIGNEILLKKLDSIECLGTCCGLLRC